MAQFSGILIIALTIIAFTDAALPNIQCVNSYPKGVAPCGPKGEHCQFDDPNNVFVLGCNDDCKANHNALQGACDENGVCVCGRNQPLRKAGKSVQCLDPTGEKQIWFNKICDEDCKCAHNTFFGVCNYATKACQCRGRHHDGQSDCPHPNGNEYFKATGRYYAALGFSPYEGVHGYAGDS